MDKDMFERLFRTALQVVGAIVATRYVGEENWAALSGAILRLGRLDDLCVPQGREMIEALAIGGAILAIIGVFAGVIWLAERKARAEVRQELDIEAIIRLRTAIEADARARERIARGELLNDDGHKRD